MSGDERRRLLDECRLLEASLADAVDEHAAGELDDMGLEKITARDRRRLAEVQQALVDLDVVDAELPAVAPSSTEPHAVARPRRRWGLLVLGALAIFVSIGALVVSQGSQQVPPTKSEVATLLVRADLLAQKGKVSEALALYSQVLAADPTQAEALAQSGFLTFEAGFSASSSQLVARGEAQVRQAAALAPKDYAPRLYLGVIELLANADPAAALKEFSAFTALHPPTKWVKKAQPYIDKAQAAVSTTTQPG